MVALRSAGLFAVLGFCLVGLLYTGVWGVQIQSKRSWSNSTPNLGTSYGGAVHVNPLAATALVVGFRGLAADLLWLKSDAYWHHGQWHRLLPVYRLIVTLQPHFLLVWSIGGWHMAYNLSYQARDRAESERWLREGIAFLKEGIAANREKADLYFDLGWTYFDRMKDYAAALPYLEMAARKSDSKVTARVLAHTYAKLGHDAKALRLWKDIARSGDSAAKKFVARSEGKNLP